MTAAWASGSDMSMWADGTRHYQTSDGLNLAVEAYVPEGEVIPPQVGELLMLVGEGRAAVKMVVRPSVAFECSEDGSPINLTPLQTFPPGTSHEEVLRNMGYNL